MNTFAQAAIWAGGVAATIGVLALWEAARARWHKGR